MYLKLLSKESGGFYSNWENKDDLISELKDVKRVESYVSVLTFRYNYFYIFLIFLLLSFEWFFRRKNGLI